MEQFEQGQSVQVRDALFKSWITMDYLCYTNGKHWVVSYIDSSSLAYSYNMIRRAKDEYGNEPLNVTEHKHESLTKGKEKQNG